MNGLDWMEKMARRSGGSESGANLLPDQSGLADAAHDGRAGAVIDHRRRFGEGCIDYRCNGSYGASLRAYDAPCVVKIEFHFCQSRLSTVN